MDQTASAFETKRVSAAEACDAIVIGSGQAGNPLAAALGTSGLKVALIERERIGGSCINWGCTPTKTLIASARVCYLARRAKRYGVAAGSVKVDFGAVLARARSIVERFRDNSTASLNAARGVELVHGEARFSGPRSVSVRSAAGERVLTAPRIFVDTGSRPAIPDVAGLRDIDYLDAENVMDLEELPSHLVVLGGSATGVEFAQMFRRFGSKVSVVERNAQLLPREDLDVAAALAEILREDGVELFLESRALDAAREPDGAVRVRLQLPSGERMLEGSHVLVAAGQVPNTDSLELHSAGVEVDRAGYIRVNAELETNVPGIYALGDVKGGPAFTHVSYDDFRVVRANLLENEHRTTAGRPPCYTIFTDPELGRIGLTEKEARSQGETVRVAKMPFSKVARAVETDDTRGFMKAVVDGSSGRILGAAVLGTGGGEIAAMLEIAMMAGLPYGALRDAMFAHPTLAESLNNLFASLESSEPEEG